MDRRSFLSTEELKERYGNPIASISEMWSHSYIYYDAIEDQFIQEKYHEEYLDTGTVYDGCFLVEDGYVWDELVRTCNEQGMAAFRACRPTIPPAVVPTKAVTMSAFLDALQATTQNRYSCQETASTLVITDASGGVLYTICKEDLYVSVGDPHCDVNKRGFRTLEEALAEVLSRVTAIHAPRGYNLGKAYEASRSKAAQAAAKTNESGRAKTAQEAAKPKKHGFWATLFGKK